MLRRSFDFRSGFVGYTILSMADEAVSKDVLLYVADFLVDELSQNAATASDTKQRVRSTSSVCLIVLIMIMRRPGSEWRHRACYRL